MSRPKDVPNRNKKFLLSRLQEMYGDDFHPIMKMAEGAVILHEIAFDTREPADIKASIDGWDKIAAYTSPKLKTVELVGDPDSPIEHKHSLFEFVPVGSDA